jgi:hypothetical protein
MIMKRPIAVTMGGFFWATLAIADPTTRAPPMVAEVRLDADPRKALEARTGEEVKVTTAEPTRFLEIENFK